MFLIAFTSETLILHDKRCCVEFRLPVKILLPSTKWILMIVSFSLSLFFILINFYEVIAFGGHKLISRIFYVGYDRHNIE